MIHYSDIVRSIKSMTLEQLIIFLKENSITCVSGSTRDAYFFDTFVVKVHNGYFTNHNQQEYQYYTEYHTKQSPVPVVYTRLYKTTDNHDILIQERLFKIVDLVLNWQERAKCKELYTDVNGDIDQREIAESHGIPFKAFLDGAQAGYNKQNKFVFFDYSRVW